VLASRFPVHVTYRLVRVHFSVQKDHLHLIVEVANREALSRALRTLAIRIARAINRVLGRKGKVFATAIT
jgi:REP element-mobilizing transposase RayT